MAKEEPHQAPLPPLQPEIPLKVSRVLGGKIKRWHYQRVCIVCVTWRVAFLDYLVRATRKVIDVHANKL